jgi:hypothetical protein
VRSVDCIVGKISVDCGLNIELMFGYGIVIMLKIVALKLVS